MVVVPQRLLSREGQTVADPVPERVTEIQNELAKLLLADAECCVPS